MPNGMVIQNLDNTFFSRGYLYATIEDTGETADGIAFGAMQSISLAHEWGTAKMRGPEYLGSVGVAFTEENLTGSAGWGVILPSQMKALLGGTVEHSGGRTTYTKKTNQEPKPFHLHCITDPDGVELEVLLYNCLAPNVQVLDVGDTRAYVMRNMDFEVHGKKLGSDTIPTLFKVVQSGNLTTSNVSQPGNTYSNDIPATLTPGS